MESKLPFALAATLAWLAMMLAATNATGQERFEGPTFAFEDEIPAGSWLRVHTVNGEIEVVEGDGTVARVRGETRREAGEIVYEVRRDGADVTICAMWSDDATCNEDGIDTRGGGRHRARVDLTVQLPRGVRLHVGTGNGELSVRGAGADVIAASGNGEISILGAGGPVQASTGNGEVTVEDAGGQVHVRSGNGEIRVSATMGPVEASTGNGSIEVSMNEVARNVELSLSTGNGSIQLHLPEDYGGTLEAHLGHGSLESDLPMTMTEMGKGGRWRGTLGEGGGRIRASSGNGDLEIRRVR